MFIYEKNLRLPLSIFRYRVMLKSVPVCDVFSLRVFSLTAERNHQISILNGQIVNFWLTGNLLPPKTNGS